MGNPFNDLASVPESFEIPLLQQIVMGQVQVPYELEDLKLFKTKREGTFRGVTVVGMRHQRHVDHLQRMKRKGHAVILVPEPANPYDENAVAVFTTMPVYNDEVGTYTWIKAGYVAKAQTCNVLDKSKIYEGRITYKQNDFWEVEVLYERVF